MTQDAGYKLADELRQALKRQRGINETLVQALEKYGRHSESCNCHYMDGRSGQKLARKCSCGFDDTMRAVLPAGSGVLSGHGAHCLCDTCVAYYAMREEI